MALAEIKKRKRVVIDMPKRKIKIRKQAHYSSSSSSNESDENDDFNPVDLADSASNVESESDAKPKDQPPQNGSAPKRDIKPVPSDRPSPSNSASNSDSDSESTSATSPPPNQQNSAFVPHKTKRNDPTAFAASISSILNSKLSGPKRSDPVLSRSATAAAATASLANEKLEKRARHKMRIDKRLALEKGRVRDVLLGTDDRGGKASVRKMGPAAAVSAGDGNVERKIQQDGGADGRAEEGGIGDSNDAEKVRRMQDLERRLRKTAQRGVVKLFNAVRQAQVRAEEVAKTHTTAGKEGGGVTSTTVRRSQREEKVEEMTRKGFLEMVASGGGGGGGGREGRGIGVGTVGKKMQQAAGRIEEA